MLRGGAMERSARADSVGTRLSAGEGGAERAQEVVCPLCGNDSSIARVSAIYGEQTHDRSGSEPCRVGLRDESLSRRGVSQSRLAQFLAPPRGQGMMREWTDAFYCRRHDVVFLPGRQETWSPAAFSQR